MNNVFIIGLPKPIRRKIEADALRNELRLKSILCDIGKEGTLTLLPHPKQAIYDLRSYIDALEGIDDAYIIVLPYAPIPKDLDIELCTIQDIGGTTVRAIQGDDGWKKMETRKPDTALWNSISQRLLQELIPVQNELPSDYFRAASEANPQLVFAEKVFEICDQVAIHRQNFLKNAADAFTQMVEKNGQVGRVDTFFSNFGLEHAQTGGIQNTLRVRKGGNCIYDKTSSVHLKQGDKTIPQAAARIYYHALLLEERYHVVVLYAGPHPDADISLTLELGEAKKGYLVILPRLIHSASW